MIQATKLLTKLEIAGGEKYCSRRNEDVMEHRMEMARRDITFAPATTSVSVADLFFHTELCRSMGPVEADNWLRSTFGPVENDTCLAANHPHESCSQSASEANSRTQSFKGLRRRSTTPMDPQLCVHVEQNRIARTRSSLSELSSAATSRHNSSSPVRLRQRPSSSSYHIKDVLGIAQTEDMQASAACPRPSEPAATTCNHQHDFDDGSNIAMLLQEHSDKAYLLFTDAAHELLD
jgi:hypothetical protein